MICKSADLLLNGTVRGVTCPSDVHGYRAVPSTEISSCSGGVLVGKLSRGRCSSSTMTREWIESTLACCDSSWGAGADPVGVWQASQIPMQPAFKGSKLMRRQNCLENGDVDAPSMKRPKTPLARLYHLRSV